MLIGCSFRKQVKEKKQPNKSEFCPQRTLERLGELKKRMLILAMVQWGEVQLETMDSIEERWGKVYFGGYKKFSLEVLQRISNSILLGSMSGIRNRVNRNA